MKEAQNFKKIILTLELKIQRNFVEKEGKS